MKLRYKIISFSSQDPNAPISNLITSNQPWESVRFCEYPQQITIQFYQPVTISSLMIVSHPTKITSRINILYCLPNNNTASNQSYVFQKYGFVTLSDNSHTNFKGRQVKKIQNINKNLLYLRLILWKNHQNPHNFFNQVGLSQIIINGSTYTGHILPHMIRSSPFAIEDYLQSKLIVLNQFKDEFAKQDDFQSAKQIKEITKIVKVQGDKIKKLDSQKRDAIREQDYNLAKQYKQKIDTIKHDIDYISTNFYDPQKKTLKPILKDSKLKLRIDELMIENGSSVHGSRIKKLSQDKQFLGDQEQDQSNGEVQDSDQNDDDEFSKARLSRVSYEDQIVPAVLHKGKKDIKTILNSGQNLEDAAYEGNQFIEKQDKPENQQVLEDLTPSAQANASVMFEFYDKDFVKKLHSKNWNFKHEAVTKFVEDTQKLSGKSATKNRVRCSIFVFNRIIKEGSYPISSASLQILDGVCRFKVQGASEVRTELHNELQKSLTQLIIKMSENQKIKERGEQVINSMFQTELFGIVFCYSVIVKAYKHTQVPKIKKIQLDALTAMVQKYGLDSGYKSVPGQIVEFAIKAAEQTNGDVRKSATSLLKTIKNRGGEQKLKESIESRPNIKNSILKQLI